MAVPRLLGITGKARAGKDTIASLLCRHYGYSSERFAGPIVKMLSAGLGVGGPYVVDRKEELIPHLGVSYRELAQTLGTEWGRHIVDPDLWVKALAHRVLKRFGNGHRVVVADVRFDNEAQWILEQGGTIWEVVRSGSPAVRGHVSEDGIDPTLVSRVIVNQGPLAEFERAIHGAMASVSAS